MTQTRILITGGNGYVGRTLTRTLGPEYDVCIADILRYGDWRFDAAERAALRLEQLDIRDVDRVATLMNEFRPDIVVHLAALHYIPECESDPGQAVSTNVLGTLNLLMACPEGSRFVFASSGAVYRPQETPHQELESPLGPDDIYGFTKLHGENYVAKIAAKRQLQAVVTRLFNVIGPGETNPHLLPELVAQLKAGRCVIELGNLTSRRDYISVRDAADGFRAAALQGEVAPGETCFINLGTSQTHSVIEIIEKIRRVSGVKFEIRQDASRVRRVDRPVLAADNRRIAAMFGWRPRHTVDDTLAELWERPDFASGLIEKYL
ncbi:NAD-dependent epimerase/dehydratase family protein [Dankookia sp. GCM10030260]|uniref:NAD-dependent epimerase/dehydratase family protein n=1 Tax=Dankookia sp. GCM10030260 TaxID=3273390 RepID=UPI0036101A78